MKYQKMIRISMMAMGLGTAALLAKPVCAQQEVDPQIFEAASDSQVQTVAQAAPSLEAPQAPAIASAAAAPLSEQDAEMEQLTPVDATVTGALLFGLGSIVLIGMVEAVRGSRRRTWKARPMQSYPLGSTAN
jgi:hypothetical protein